MGGKPGAKRGEPDVPGAPGGKRPLQGHQHARAADISVVPENSSGFQQRKSRQLPLQSLDDIAAAGVRNNRIRLAGTMPEQLADRLGRKGWHRAVELIFQPASGIHKTNFFPVLRPVNRFEAPHLQLVSRIRPPPQRGRRTIAKQAQADETSRVIVKKEGS